jgi:hypothetical protein
MKPTAFSICLVIVAIAEARLDAASFTSSRTFDHILSTSLRIRSYRNNGASWFDEHSYENATQIKTGVVSATATADTSTRLGRFEALQLSPFGLTSNSVTSSVSTTTTGIIGNFPEPPTQQTIQGTWTERITIDGIAGLPPTLILQNARSLETYESTAPWYTAFFSEALSASPFTISGTYELIGPITTRTVPWSFEFVPQEDSAYANLGVKGVDDFTDGFVFEPFSVYQTYTTDQKSFFEGSVDGLYISVRFETDFGARLDLPFSPGVPEPASAVLDCVGFLLMWQRRKQCPTSALRFARIA